MAIWIWVNVDPGNGVLPGGTKPLPEPKMLVKQLTFIREHFTETSNMNHEEYHQASIIRRILAGNNLIT